VGAGAVVEIITSKLRSDLEVSLQLGPFAISMNGASGT